MTVAKKMLICSLLAMASLVQAKEGWVSTATHAIELNQEKTGKQAMTVRGRTATSENIHFVVALKPRDEAGLRERAESIMHGDRSKVLSGEQLMQMHLPDNEQIKLVLNHLTQCGAQQLRVAGNRLLIDGYGKPNIVEQCFNTQIRDVTINGSKGYANITDAQVPAHLGHIVSAVLGLKKLQKANTLSPVASLGQKIISDPGCPVQIQPGAHELTDFETIYNAQSLSPASNTVVGIITAGGMDGTRNDLMRFWNDHYKPAGIPEPNVTISYQGSKLTPPESTDCGQMSEWRLDSQAVLAAAGGQLREMILYAADSFEYPQLLLAINRAASDAQTRQADKPKAISMSFALCEQLIGADTIQSTDTIFQSGVVSGMIWAAGSGDWGSPDSACGETQRYPASSPWVVAVGGTTLITQPESPAIRIGETVWNNKLGATGGGILTMEPMPAWQSMLLPTPTVGQGLTRRIPDIALAGDPATGARIYVNGIINGLGGTSLSTPLFAGFWARMQSANDNTLTDPHNVIYAYAARNPAFWDVTSGNNGACTAGPGWDCASGWGSLNIAAFANLLSSPAYPPLPVFECDPLRLSGTLPGNTLPSSGGDISVEIQCAHAPASYRWTLDNVVVAIGPQPQRIHIPNNDFPEKSMPHQICAMANLDSLENGFAPRVCSTVSVAEQVCEIKMDPPTIPAAGGEVNARLECSNKLVKYFGFQWKIDDQNVGKDSLSLTVTIAPNTGTTPIDKSISVRYFSAVPLQRTATWHQDAQPAIPVCTQVTVTPDTVDYNGAASVSADATCNGAGTLTYSWTIDGSALPGNTAHISDPVGKNTTRPTHAYQVCVIATNTNNDHSPQKCATLTQTAPPAPVCSKLILTPSELSYQGGVAQAQSVCSGAGVLTYSWTINGQAYPGSASSIFGTIGANPDRVAHQYPVCFTASNAGGISRQVCANLTQDGAPPPVCSSVSLSPAALPYTGGQVNAQANCSGEGGLSYRWTLGGQAYPGTAASNSGNVARNTATSPVSVPVCVTASNASGAASNTVCSTLTEDGAPPPPPVCSGVSLSPASLPASGGQVSGSARCTGSGNLSYAWTINGSGFGGSGASNSGSLGANPDTSSHSYSVCVTASNNGGTSNQSCATLTQAAAPPPPPRCSGVTVSPSFLPPGGGSATASAHCTGSDLTYSWSFAGYPYGDNSSSISGDIGPNTSGTAQAYSVCVRVSNSSGSSSSCGVVRQH